MNIGIDVDSGERSFLELSNGVLKAALKYPKTNFFIIGKKNRIESSLRNLYDYKNVILQDAKEVVAMNESPINALKKKKESTVLIGAKMIKDQSIDLFFSAGNTGATVVASVIVLGMLDKVLKKPAMGAFFPCANGGETLILDIGANPESNEETLFYNALLGQAYYNAVWDKPEPTIGLLNMGAELGKGTTNIKKAFNILSKIPAFLGNVEGYDLLNGHVDVVVCDGFTGNSILKFAEAMRELFSATIKDVFSEKKQYDSSQSLLTYTFNALGVYKEKKRMIVDRITPKYYGGAPLLGVNGSVIIGHGMCKGSDVINAIDLAHKLYSNRYLEKLGRSLTNFR